MKPQITQINDEISVINCFKRLENFQLVDDKTGGKVSMACFEEGIEARDRDQDI